MRFQRLALTALAFLTADCAKVRRDYTVDLTAAASAADQAASAYFERRQAVALTLPQSTIDALTAAVKGELDGKEIDAPDVTARKKSAKDGLKVEHRFEKVTFKACIKDVSLTGTGRGKIDVLATVRGCGLEITVKGGELRITPPSTGGRPVILTIGKLSLKPKPREDVLRFNMQLALRQDGRLEILGTELVDGLQELVDPAHYDVDVSLSGAEEASGWLGKSVNEARADLIAQLVSLGRAQVVIAIERTMQKAAGAAAKRVTRASLAKGFAIRTKGLEVKVAARLSGLSGSRETGVTVVANTLIDMKSRLFAGTVGSDATTAAASASAAGPASKITCRIGHGLLPPPKPSWIGEIEELGNTPVGGSTEGDPAAGGAGDRSTAAGALSGAARAGDVPPAPGTPPVAPAVERPPPAATLPGTADAGLPPILPEITSRGRVFIPFELFSHAAWLVGGDSGDCTIPQREKGEFVGDIKIRWNNAAKLKFTPSARDGRTGVRIDTTFGPIALSFAPEVVKKLREAGVPPTLFPDEVPVYTINDFSFPLFAEIAPATSTTTPKLYFAVENQKRYGDLTDFDVRYLAEDVIGGDPNAAFARGFDAAVRATVRSLADQTLAPIFSSQAVEIATDANQPVTLGNLAILDAGLSAAFAAEISPDKPEPAPLRLADGPPAAVAAPPSIAWLDVLAMLGMPALVGLDAVQAQAIASKTFPQSTDWACTDIPNGPIPGPDFSTIGVGYRACTRAPDDSVELGWTTSSIGQEHDAARRDVVVATRLIAAPTATKASLPALNARTLIQALPTQPTIAIEPPSVRLTWKSDQLVVIATGFCREADPAACTDGAVITTDIMQVVELRSYVP